MTRRSILACLLVLQCALHWCSAKETTYRLESFMRLDKEDRFLKAEWDRYGNPVNVSFTGLEKNLDTVFIFKGKHPKFTIHPKGKSEYTLAIEKGSLVVKNSRYMPRNVHFGTKRVKISFAKDKYLFHVIYSSSTGIKETAIKSTRSGKVELMSGYSMTDRVASWIRIIYNFP